MYDTLEGLYDMKAESFLCGIYLALGPKHVLISFGALSRDGRDWQHKILDKRMLFTEYRNDGLL